MKNLESRTEVQCRVSQVTGQTKGDREDHIAYLLVQMEKDLAVISDSYSNYIKQISSMKNLSKVRGLKTRIADIETTTTALRLVQKSCDNILSLTKKKKYVKDAERRFAVAEKHNEKLEKARAAVKGKASSKESSIKAIICRYSSIEENTVLNNDDEVKKPSPKTITPEKSEIDEDSVVVTLNDGTKVTIPEPSYDEDKAVYTIRELIIHLSPHDGKGLKRIINELKNQSRCLFSPTSFVRKLAQYKSNPKRLPEVNDYGDIRGRPPSISTVNITEINNKEHQNLSYTGDGLEESREAIVKNKKKRAAETDLDINNIGEVDRTTVANYDTFSTIFDPDIAKVSGSTPRIKSVNREIMSRSIRTCFSSATSAIASSFRVGKIDKKVLESLPEESKLAFDIASRSKSDVDLKPIELYQQVNSDDIGRFVIEGIQVATSRKTKCRKTSKKSIKRDTRKTSSLWRRATDDDNYKSGIKVKFKSLISGCGHTGPIVLHFYGLTSADITDDFIVHCSTLLPKYIGLNNLNFVG